MSTKKDESKNLDKKTENAATNNNAGAGEQKSSAQDAAKLNGDKLGEGPSLGLGDQGQENSNDNGGEKLDNQNETLDPLTDKSTLQDQGPEETRNAEVKQDPPVVLVEGVPEVHRTPTFGQKLVGAHFNPAGMSEVDYAKSKCANLIDTLHGVRLQSTSAQKNAFASQAIDAIVVAQMLAVKCLTWTD